MFSYLARVQRQPGAVRLELLADGVKVDFHDGSEYLRATFDLDPFDAVNGFAEPPEDRKDS